MKFEIKSRWSGAVLFSIETDSWKLAIEAAVKSRADLSRADLSRADLSRANLSRADLSRADLYGANLDGADLSRADLSRANLYGANLYGADLSRANLYGANLDGANLYGANLYGADLSRADLSRANLYGANLDGADLSRADLSRADLSRANLYGANLDGADLFRANLYGAKGIDAARYTPLLMLLDQPGPIRAYKLVTEDGVGPFNGGITYKVGKKYSVKDANTDPNEQCGAGINLASLDWCLREWQEGYRVLIAEFTAKDIAAIPTATDGKFRVHRCKIVGEKDISELLKKPEPVKAEAD